MELFAFWRKWLIVMGVLHVLAGAILFLPALIGLEFPHISSAFWQSGIVPDRVKAFYIWTFAVYSAMKIAWALFIIFVAQFPFKKKERWSWYCLFVCISTWFVIDSFFSYSFGALDKVIGNSVFYILSVLPLIFTWRHFRSNSQPEK